MFATDNILLLTDSYKVSHYKQYPPGTQTVYSYFESRGGEFPETVFFGLRYFLERYLAGQVVTNEKIHAAEKLLERHFASGSFFNREGWRHIVDAHGGKLPIRIKSVPEGTVVPTGNVLMTIENTDPSCYWLTNYLETLLVQVWYPSTVATQSRSMKQTIAGYLRRTGTIEGLPFKLHDFGFRGVSSVETAALGGAAHLINFLGTDNLAGIALAQQCYDAEMPGFSIPAAEHSTLTSWGREHEVDAYRNMLSQFPTGLVAVVSDSYDIFNACDRILGIRVEGRGAESRRNIGHSPRFGRSADRCCSSVGDLGPAFWLYDQRPRISRA
ncbi:MAG: nicotinamide phosphoribosyltransferase domain-containing protein [Pirellulales bacterium]